MEFLVLYIPHIFACCMYATLLEIKSLASILQHRSVKLKVEVNLINFFRAKLCPVREGGLDKLALFHFTTKLGGQLVS